MGCRRNVAVKLKISENCEDIPLPYYATEHSSGMDVCAANKGVVRIMPGCSAFFPAGFSMEIPEGFEAQIRSRSGLAHKHGVFVLNSPGTIDSDYRGEVGVVLMNLGSEVFEVARGMRIAQMVICPVVHATLFSVDLLSDTLRGVGGFGHTGV